VLGGLDPGGDRGLAAARLVQLGLQLGDVAFGFAQCGADGGDLLLKLGGHGRQLLLFDQRAAGEILAALFERQLGTLGPARLEMLDHRDLPALSPSARRSSGRPTRAPRRASPPFP
jgi:hypothetical protein